MKDKCFQGFRVKHLFVMDKYLLNYFHINFILLYNCIYLKYEIWRNCLINISYNILPIYYILSITYFFNSRSILNHTFNSFSIEDKILWGTYCVLKTQCFFDKKQQQKYLQRRFFIMFPIKTGAKIHKNLLINWNNACGFFPR